MTGIPVLPGKKEAKKRKRTIREEATRKKHRALSKKRKVDPLNFENLVPVLLPWSGNEPAWEHDVDALRERAHREVAYSGIERSAISRTLFDPNLACITELPFGFFDHKREEVPPEMIPSGDDIEKELFSLCQRMVVCNGDDAILEYIFEAWPGRGDWYDKLEVHASRLTQLGRFDRHVFQALLSGYHGDVIDAIADKRLSPSLSPERVIDLLYYQGLLWCAHDVQLALARNAWAEDLQVEGFLKSNLVRMQPKTFVNAAAKADDYLGKFIALQNFPESKRQAAVDAMLASVGRSSIKDLKKAANAIVPDAAKSNQAKLLDGYTQQILSKRRDDLHPLQALLADKNSLEALPPSFHQQWFGSTLQEATAITLMRYLQAENEIRDMIASAIQARKVRGKFKPVTPMRWFDVAMVDERPVCDIGKSLQMRFRKLFHAYRVGLIKDTDDRGEEEMSASAGKTMFARAVEMLATSALRRNGDEKGPADCAHKIFYLLDVIPEYRLNNRCG